MSPTLKIALLWLGFAGSHIGLSSVPVRPRLVATLGELAFRGLYSVVALGFFIPLVSVYFGNKHAGAWLWTVPQGPLLRATVYVAMGVAFILVVASQVRPSPASLVPGDSKPRGIYRITRHPFLMGVALFALAHLLPNGSTADVAFFGGFALFAFLGAWHQDARKRALEAPRVATFYEATPFLPFTGRETARGLAELSPVTIVLAIAATVAVRYFHTGWFGG
jgi:uncharacterized membrane protein